MPADAPNELPPGGGAGPAASGAPAGSAPAPLDVGDAEAVARTFTAAAAAHRDDPRRVGATVHLPAGDRLWVTGDLHDHTLNFRRALRASGLDAADATDDAGDLLLLQEVIHGPDEINGMDLSVRLLARCAELKRRFPRRLLTVLSNHELAQRRGERITKEGRSVTEAFDAGLNFLYGEHVDAVRVAMHAYLDALPLAVRTRPDGARGVLMTHSLPSPKHIDDFDPSVLDREPRAEDFTPAGSAYRLVWGRYHNAKITAELADTLAADVLLVGHQPADMGYEPFGDEGLILAADHGHGQILPLDTGATVTRDGLMDALVPLAAVRTD